MLLFIGRFDFNGRAFLGIRGGVIDEITDKDAQEFFVIFLDEVFRIEFPFGA